MINALYKSAKKFGHYIVIAATTRGNETIKAVARDAYGLRAIPPDNPASAVATIYEPQNNPAKAVSVNIDVYDGKPDIQKGETVLWSIGGNKVLLLTDGTIQITGDTTINGNLHVNGTITASGNISADGDVVAGSVSLQGHVHGGVESGSSQTSPPV